MEDIRTKAHLNNTQKIGLKHYDDFLDRMPREEAAAIEKVVMHLLKQYLLNGVLKKIKGDSPPIPKNKIVQLKMFFGYILDVFRVPKGTYSSLSPLMY